MTAMYNTGRVSCVCCFLLLLFSVKVVRSTEVYMPGEKIIIINKINDMRGQVNPPAANMQTMTWSDQLANEAQDSLRHCFLNWNMKGATFHQQPRKGANKFSTTLAGLRKWNDEGKEYNFHMNDCSHGCYAYKQLVWAAATQVGCGAKSCRNLKLPGTTFVPKNRIAVVCKYNVHQHWSTRPYVKKQQ